MSWSVGMRVSSILGRFGVASVLGTHVGRALFCGGFGTGLCNIKEGEKGKFWRKLRS